MPRYVLINGAPRAGKDTIAMHLWNTKEKMQFDRFSMPHKRAFAEMMGVNCDGWGNVEHYEETKGEIIAVLGASFRQWQIDFSEKFMKPCYGQDVFGRMLRVRTMDFDDWTVVVPDCGFQVEVDMLADRPALLITVKRDGCDFSKDSREYVTPAKGWTHVTIDNNGTLEDLYRRVDKVYNSWCDQQYQPSGWDA
jgi:hypothetical protein